jgi:hypothetical protein
MSMRESIARAMLAKDYPGDVGGEMEELWWDRHGHTYLRYADAALDALMEPTVGMKNAGCLVGPDTNHGEFSWDDAEFVYSSMIRAARAP